MQVGSCNILATDKVRNLGVIMDKHLNMVPHINYLVQSAFMKIREISYYRRFLSPAATKTLTHAYVTSRLDYCNGLLYGLPREMLAKLQSVLHTAARLVSRTRKYDNITPVLIELHWLPIEYRIQFKILLQVFKCLNNMAPAYLSNKLTMKPNNGLRSDNQNLLLIPICKLKYYGDRSFSVAGPKLWNGLPRELRQYTSVDGFKRALKTYLFKLAYHTN